MWAFKSKNLLNCPRHDVALDDCEGRLLYVCMFVQRSLCLSNVTVVIASFDSLYCYFHPINHTYDYSKACVCDGKKMAGNLTIRSTSNWIT